MRGFLSKIFGDPNERELKRLRKIVDSINALEPEMQALSDEALRAKTEEFKARLAEGETLDDLLPEAFATVREAARRTINMRHFDVQLMAGIVLHEGKIAEMKTGEGKTLVATLPLYLNALLGRGCHLVTPNDYLARVGGGWMGPIYHFLGLRVGVICHEFSAIYDPEYQDPNPSPDDRLNHWRPVSRREAYLADITYGTNNEFGFDYLRDNLVYRPEDLVQRELYYAIVDEVDNILIDEARTPLIISGPAHETVDRYYQFAQIARQLKKDVHYTVDLKYRAITLTDAGIDRVEQLLNIPPGQSLYDDRYADLVHYLEQALKAKELFHRDRDYIVRDGEIIIVDEFTGRLMPGRRYSEGLHQAIEAKEGVRVRSETVTQATITFQNYFRMYEKLAGMTGTAATEAEEFATIYNLEVVVIPTHKPMIRIDYPDVVYRTEEAKFRAVVREIKEMHAQGRPVLVGTTSIEKSEYLSNLLKREGIPHEVLNAKHHEREALIVAKAGQPGAVTIATNMAGRGTDIVLGPGVAEKGGLHVIGTERHEARRIDNQLRGRAGRQGDPGSSRFFVSLEDELLRRFGSDRIQGLLDRLGVDDDTPIEHPLVSRTIESAQTKVEGYNFDLRKHLVEYDNVINKHREVIYAERRKIIQGENLRDNVLAMIERQVAQMVEQAFTRESTEGPDVEGLARAFCGLLNDPAAVTPAELSGRSADEVKELLQERALARYAAREAELGEETMRTLERLVMLRVIDQLWVEHLTEMEHMRQSIGLQAYGQIDPLVAYKTEGYRMFQQLLKNIEYDVSHLMYRVQLAPAITRPVLQGGVPNRSGDGNGSRPAKKRKVGRNDPCPCGSGKKYKQCCLPKELGARAAVPSSK
ncbi:preprotein translocase subunit SecA [Thermorudis peleae]|uniref:preprotein translocase subunit SecA n=1 Tax=Thermorudis peleae TaxID=1382356 RepID=UPI00056FADAE|nr:preprotein translocase subunit SecA [Thermorudis peleae]